MKLFDIPPKEPDPPRKDKCQNCKHSQRWQCGGSIIWYCSARKSNRTFNKLLKIKARQEACDNYKEIKL